MKCQWFLRGFKIDKISFVFDLTAICDVLSQNFYFI